MLIKPSSEIELSLNKLSAESSTEKFSLGHIASPDCRINRGICIILDQIERVGGLAGGERGILKYVSSRPARINLIIDFNH